MCWVNRYKKEGNINKHYPYETHILHKCDEFLNYPRKYTVRMKIK